MIEFCVFGKPSGKARPRFRLSGHAYNEKKTKTYEQQVGVEFIQAGGGSESRLPGYDGAEPAAASKKISLEAEISFDAAAGKKYSTPDYTFTYLPDSTQRKIRRVLEEAALYVTGKSAQTVLNFGNGQEPKALESGRKKVTA